MLVYQSYNEKGELEPKKKQLRKSKENAVFSNSDEAKEAFANSQMKESAKIELWLLAEEIIAKPIISIQTVFESYEELSKEVAKEIIIKDEIPPIGAEEKEEEIYDPEDQSEYTYENKNDISNNDGIEI
jgi:hypothetical protein